MTQKKGVVVLGSTGSIGVNTLDVIARHPDRFELVALTAATQVDTMLTQCQRFQPQVTVMASESHARELRDKLRACGLNIEVQHGARAIAQVAAHPAAEVVMAAIVGAVGLAPCLAAARAGKRLLLANKEALVVGGSLFIDAVRAGGAMLLPIDSEHSAIFQSLPEDPATWSARVDRIILTASGGPFRLCEPSALRDVTPEQAYIHPNWRMGRKISVDSATMMNKALEVIEAHFLFGVSPEQLQVVIHSQSVIHSMVQYRDSSVVAQLGTPDMRVPIAYGLSWPDRMVSGAAALDFCALQDLSFESVDTPAHQARYPGLALAWEVLKSASGSSAVLNAANEVAVQAFLERQIRFDQIYHVNRATLDDVQLGATDSLEALLELDAYARTAAHRVVGTLAR